MNFYKLTIFCFPILFFAAFSQANAQACGTYYVKITVQNEDGKPINNAVVNLLPIEKDETRGKNFVRDAADRSRFSIDYPEGYSFRSLHKLTIAAEGFQMAENKVAFTSCQDRDVVVKLALSNSAAVAVWQFKNNINIQVIGDDGKYLEDVRLIIGDDAKNNEKLDMKFGSAFFYLPSGKYQFRFEKSGYRSQELKVDLTMLAGKSLKVELKPEGNR